MLALMVVYTIGGLWLLSRADRARARRHPGLIAETAIGLAVAGVLVVVWFRERRRRARGERPVEARMRE